MTMTTAKEAYESAVKRLVDLDEGTEEYEEVYDEVQVAREAYCDSDEPRTWVFGGEGGEGHDDVTCRPAELDLQEIAEDGTWDVDPEKGSIAVLVTATCEETDEKRIRLCIIDPEEPACPVDEEHEWTDALDLVGGCKSSPGIFANGAGITSIHVCGLCGMKRVYTTCSQGRHAETEYDHDKTHYEEDAVSLEDLAAHHEGDPPEAALDAMVEGKRPARDLVVACYQWASQHQETDTIHETAEDWYEAYGWHLPTQQKGDVELQVVLWSDLDSEDEDIVQTLTEDGLTREEAQTLVAKAREIREAAEGINRNLEAAVTCWEQHDIETCVRYLLDARRSESEHGDTPATDALGEKLFGYEGWLAFRNA